MRRFINPVFTLYQYIYIYINYKTTVDGRNPKPVEVSIVSHNFRTEFYIWKCQVLSTGFLFEKKDVDIKDLYFNPHGL